jgi:hypothetical protein
MEHGSSGTSQGFKNVEPQSREERAASRNKDLLEKTRIAARHNAGSNRLPPLNPISPHKNSAQYIEEYDRFNRDGE